MLTGAGSIYNAGLEVGSNNSNGVFSGVISGSSSVKKSGTGLWVLSGVNTYTGTTSVSAGTMTLSGSISTGTVTVSDGAAINLTGTMGGSLIISSGGTATVTGTISSVLSNGGTLKGTGTISGAVALGSNSITAPGNSSIGKLNFGGTVTMNTTASLNMEVTGGSTSCDKLVLNATTGILTCSGTLNVSLSSGTFVVGDSYQLFSAPTINGTFTTINLPSPGNSLEWDLSELYTTGTIKIKQSTAVHNPEIKSGVVQNPTTGIFRIYTDKTADNMQVSVSNSQGKIVYQSNVGESDGQFKVDLTNQPDGVYLLKINSDKESSNIVKLIKQ